MLNIWASQQWAAAPIPDPPASASHIWLFDEGSGTAVADQVGDAPIDLSIASNATWIDDGIHWTSRTVYDEGQLLPARAPKLLAGV